MSEGNPWIQETVQIRSVILDTGLSETTKWGIPVFTLNGKNIVGIATFKNHLAIWFYNGVFLRDEMNVLLNAQEEKTKALRQWRIYKGEKPDLKLLRSYVLEAIQNQQEGKVWKAERTNDIDIPLLLASRLKKDKSLNAAFKKLGLSKQKEFSEYIRLAKREETRLARLEKIIPLILEGKGLNDKYK